MAKSHDRLDGITIYLPVDWSSLVKVRGPKLLGLKSLEKAKDGLRSSSVVCRSGSVVRGVALGGSPLFCPCWRKYMAIVAGDSGSYAGCLGVICGWAFLHKRT